HVSIRLTSRRPLRSHVSLSHCRVDHLLLPSFPTRRSSDLGWFSALQMVYPFESAAYNTAVGEVSRPVRTRFGYHIIRVDAKRPRSEEHTSELQSRENLVCRLLLEKKNNSAAHG